MYDRSVPATDLTVFILAGGKSSRMGTDKAFVEVEGRTLLARALDLARSVTDDVRIVGQQEKYSSFAPTVEDNFPGCGPLGGIHAALRASEKDLNLVLAVDIPFVTAALLKHLAKRASDSSALVTVPYAGRGYQPLCALYRRAFADAAELALRAGRYKIDALFDSAHMQVISEQELQTAGFPADIFRNLNTPEDLASAHQFPD